MLVCRNRSGGREPVAPAARSDPREVRRRILRLQPSADLIPERRPVGLRRVRRRRPPRNPASRCRSAAGRSRRSSGSSRCAETTRRSAASARNRLAIPGRASLHRSRGQTSVIGSTTWRSWLRPSSVNRLCGWWAAVGRSPSRGRRPVSSAGTASVVRPATVVALRYQVASAATDANAGNRRASICSRRPSGRWWRARRTRPSPPAYPRTTCPPRPPTRRSGSTSSDTGETTRNSSEEQQRGGRQHGHERPHGGSARVQRRGARSNQRRERHAERRPGEQVAGRRQHEGRDRARRPTRAEGPLPARAARDRAATRPASSPPAARA